MTNKLHITRPLVYFVLVVAFYACSTKSDNKNTTSVSTNHSRSPKADTIKYLSRTKLLEYLTQAGTITPGTHNGKPFDTMVYDKVIAYDFVGSEEPFPGVLHKGEFVPVIVKQQALTQQQADRLLAALAKKSTYGEATAACFVPHFGLLFVKNNTIVYSLNVCLDCNYLIADFEIPAMTHKKASFESGEEYALVGFTKKGKESIVALCKELGFTYGIGNRK